MNEEENKEKLTEEEEIALAQYIEQKGFPQSEEKPGIYQIFNKIIKDDDEGKQIFDTIKTAAINENELDAFRHLRKASVISRIFKYDLITEYLVDSGEVIMASSLSCSKRKPGAFLQALVTMKKEFVGKVGDKVKKGGLFGGKKEE